MWQTGIDGAGQAWVEEPVFISHLPLAPDSKPENKQGSVVSGIPSTPTHATAPLGRLLGLCLASSSGLTHYPCIVSVLHVSLPYHETQHQGLPPIPVIHPGSLKTLLHSCLLSLLFFPKLSLLL